MRRHLCLLAVSLILLSGCQPNRSAVPPAPNTDSPDNPRPQVTQQASQFMRVVRTESPVPDEVAVHVSPISEAEALRTVDESILNLTDTDGILNYATSQFPDKSPKTVRILQNASTLQTLSVPADWNEETKENTLRISGIPIPPPGVTIDRTIRPVAPISASREQKVRALRKVGESQLGVKYVWGANKDEGQNGFDCSNYTAYVYRHALGYKFSTSSRKQHRNVGVPVPLKQMRAGDLITFRDGAHVGIYMGNGEMIQMGGGTGKCTYLPLRSGSYWYGKISKVKRMF